MKKLIIVVGVAVITHSSIFPNFAFAADTPIAEIEKKAKESEAAAQQAKEKAEAAAAEAAKTLKAAQDAAHALAQAKGTVPQDAKAANDAALAEQLKGFGLGAGIGALLDIGGSPRISAASVDANGIIRVQEDQSVRVGVILETHYLWKIDSGGVSADSRRIFFHGPQVAAVLGNNVIDGLGIGYMMALRRRNIESPNFALKSFNLGAGVMAQPSVQTLGKGLKADEPLPAGDQLRYHKGPKAGVYVVFSVGF